MLGFRSASNIIIELIKAKVRNSPSGDWFSSLLDHDVLESLSHVHLRLSSLTPDKSLAMSTCMLLLPPFSLCPVLFLVLMNLLPDILGNKSLSVQSC